MNQNRIGDARRSGQVIVMFALFLTSMIGVLGLAVDLGFTYSGKRTVQNAADGAALAGARAVAKWTATTPTSAQSEAQAIALAASNTMSISTQTLVSCEYVDYSNAVVGSCAGSMPASARGVKAVVEENHDTFFIQAVPGAPDEVTTRASAIANVQMFGAPTAGPFIVCGINTMLAGNGNARFSILKPDGSIDPNAYGKEYKIHGPQVEDCGAPSESYNGTSVRSNANDNKRPGDIWIGDTGTQAGPTRFAVNGIKGCAAGINDDAVDDCILLLPIATNDPAAVKTGNEFSFNVLQIAAFHVKRTGANKHTGTLLAGYVVTGQSTNTWCRTCAGIGVIRLVA